jgi:hypothetical protein
VGVWSSKDEAQIRARGMTVEQVEDQIARFVRGFPPLTLDRPCIVGDGIRTLAESEIPLLEARFREAQLAGRISKFVPASGAASRMFHFLSVALHRDWDLDDGGLAARAEDEARSLQEFFARWRELPFAESLRASTLALLDASERAEDESALFRKTMLRALLTEEGLGYADLPKGLIPFHRYGGQVRTAFEEHLLQALAYVQSADGTVRIHFTVPEPYRNRIDDHLSTRAASTNAKFEISLSVQDPASDTIAVDESNAPARDARGELMFRPGGHGALLRNLEEFGGDLVFVRNIDNIHAERPMQGHFHHERMGGMLLAVQETMDHFLVRLEDPAQREQAIPEAASFLERVLCRRPAPSMRHALAHSRPSAPDSDAQAAAWLIDELARPLRVCGMVRNEGEPGGGPFWVRHSDGSSSIQIVEKSQIRLEDETQKQILEASTHFNPVDLICSLRDRHGNLYSLDDFRDPDSGIITEKTAAGRTLRALEWPGLWNGAMARWNTVFVEIPLECFNPVKTVLDLLRPAHRAAE